MQDQPVMRIAAERLGRDLVQPKFDFERVLARCKAGAVADAEDVRIDGERLFAERSVQHHVGRLTAYAWQALQLFASARDLGRVIANQCLAERDYVLRLRVEQPNCLDLVTDRLFA
jgi:hypothetical protein